MRAREQARARQREIERERERESERASGLEGDLGVIGGRDAVVFFLVGIIDRRDEPFEEHLREGERVAVSGFRVQGVG